MKVHTIKLLQISLLSLDVSPSTLLTIRPTHHVLFCLVYLLHLIWSSTTVTMSHSRFRYPIPVTGDSLRFCSNRCCVGNISLPLSHNTMLVQMTGQVSGNSLLVLLSVDGHTSSFIASGSSSRRRNIIEWSIHPSRSGGMGRVQCYASWLVVNIVSRSNG